MCPKISANFPSGPSTISRISKVAVKFKASITIGERVSANYSVVKSSPSNSYANSWTYSATSVMFTPSNIS